MVVNLSVIDDPDAFVFIGDRLMPGADVDNAQPPHGESDILFHQETAVVRSAMHDLLIHRGEHVRTDAPVSIGMEDSADSTHNYLPVRLGSVPASAGSGSGQKFRTASSFTTISSPEKNVCTSVPELIISYRRKGRWEEIAFLPSISRKLPLHRIKSFAWDFASIPQ